MYLTSSSICYTVSHLSDFLVEEDLAAWTQTQVVQQLWDFLKDPVIHDDNFFRCYEPRRSLRASKKSYYCPPKTTGKVQVEYENRKTPSPRGSSGNDPFNK